MAGKVLLTPGNRLHIKFEDNSMEAALIEGLGPKRFFAIYATANTLLALFDGEHDRMLIFTDIKKLGARVFIARYIGAVPMEAIADVAKRSRRTDVPPPSVLPGRSA